MKTYPSISYKGPHQPCYAFVKYDGSNIRIEYSPKRGWYKYGTRKTLFDKSHELYGSIPELFHQKYQGLEKLFNTNVTVFAEWFGPNSFAGQHQNEPKNLIIFDININKKGFLNPKEFSKLPTHQFSFAECIGQFNFNNELINNIKNENIKINSLTDIPEGVVCKGGNKHSLWMAKIKTNRWLEKLKTTYQNWNEYV